MIPTTAAVDAQLTAPTAKQGLLIEIGGSNPERITTFNVDSVDWDGRTWVGQGVVMDVAPIVIAEDTLQTEFSIVLGAQDPARLARLANDIRGEPFELWTAFLVSGAIVADPILERYGTMYPGEITDFRMRVSVESRFNFPRNLWVSTYSDNEQRGIDAADGCFHDVTNRTEEEVERWRYVQKSGLGLS